MCKREREGAKHVTSRRKIDRTLMYINYTYKELEVFGFVGEVTMDPVE